MDAHAAELLLRRYPQLHFPIRENMKDTPEYRNAVLRGMPVSGEAAFRFSEEDILTAEETPAGRAEILILARRESFVQAMQALAYRCEPVPVPDSVGANTIRGLINWEKIHRHREEYLAAGGTDWKAEFRRFTAVKANYLDSLILLSSGDYSNIHAEAVGLGAAEWKEKSLTIRKFHELTHFVCRTLYPEDIVPIRDEVLADLIGLVKAFGDYDPNLARLFLGIEGESFRPGGRLQHYAANRLEEATAEANAYIEHYARRIQNRQKEDVFSLLLDVFPEVP